MYYHDPALTLPHLYFLVVFSYDIENSTMEYLYLCLEQLAVVPKAIDFSIELCYLTGTKTKFYVRHLIFYAS